MDLSKLKEVYFNLEDKYYTQVEKLKLVQYTDKIDQYVPSFALFIALGILIVLLIGYALLVGPAAGQVTFVVKDEFDEPLAGVDLMVSFLGQELNLTTNESGEATAQIPQGASVLVEAGKAGFDSKSVSFDVSEPAQRFPIILSSLISLTRKTITLTTPDGALLQEEATVSFRCGNLGITPPATQTVRNGVVEVSPDPNCGELCIQVDAASYKTLSMRCVGEETAAETIYLSQYEAGKGSVIAMVNDEDGIPVDAVEVTLMSSLGVPIGPKTAYQGSTRFDDVSVGDYYLSVRDPAGEFALTETGLQAVSKDSATTMTAVLTRTVKGNITVNVTDSKTQEPLANATVRIAKSLGGNPINSQTTGSSGSVVFPVGQTVTYYITAYHDDYLNETKEVASPADNPTIDIGLEKLTPENSGFVQAKVIDEYGLPIESAQVFIYDASTDWLYPINPAVTDANGIAEFKGLKAGNYYLKAIKFLAEAVSEVKPIEVQSKNYFPITIERGEGSIKVNVIDVEAEPLSFATVEIHPVGEGTPVSALTDASGSIQVNFPAQQRAYIRVSKEGYAGWVSHVFTILPNQLVEFTAPLEVTITGETPSIEFLGLFESDTASTPVEEVKAGNTYIARLQIKVPEEADYRELGVHLRTGKTELMQKDTIYIKDAWAVDSQIIKGSSFNPPNGWATDSTNLVYGDAKWVNIVFNDMRMGVYNASAEVRVKREVVPGDAVPFHYRVWAETKDNRILRTPGDVELGNNRSTGSKDELYAQSNEKIYWEGQPALCDADFCYAGERILDAEDNLFKFTPYTVALFGRHKLFFEITNNSDTVHNNAEIRIKNSVEGMIVDNTLEINGYRVVNANAQEFSNDSTTTYQISPLPLGSFIKNRSVVGEIDFTPKKVGTSNFEITIVSEGIEVFKKIVPVSVLADKAMEAELTPDVLPAFVPVEAELTVKDSDGFAVNDARIIVTKITNNNSRIQLATYYTNLSGRIEFTLPGSLPGSRFLIEVEKTGYESTSLEKVVSQDIVAFNPDLFASSLETIAKREEILNTEATNLINTKLKIKEASISGYFKGYLDTTSMNDYAGGFAGAELEPDSPRNLALLKTALISDIDRTFLPDSVDGHVNLILESSELGKMWPYSLPFTVDITHGAPPIESCLYVESDNINWETISQGETIATEVEIYNRCESNGQPIRLENLQATIEWQGNVLGNVDVTITDPEAQLSHTATLRQGRWENFIGSMGHEEQGFIYIASIEFAPKAGHIGEAAQFNVKFGAELETDAGVTKVGANTDVMGNITILNLRECVKVTPDPEIGLRLARDEDEKTFTIDTSDCIVPLDLRFCFGDPNCKGGTAEGGIIVSPGEDAPIYDVSGEKTIKVERLSKGKDEVPGMYGLTIDAKPPGRAWYPVKTLEVIIEPTVHQYFWLDKYKFNIWEVGSKDSTSLYNDRYKENVLVTASKYQWGKSAKYNDYQIAGLSASAGVISGLSAYGITWLAGVTTGGGPVGWAIGAAIAITVAIMLYVDKEKMHDDMKTYSLEDYVIELTRDKKMVELDNLKIDGNWNTNISNVFADASLEKTVQEVGLVFENTGITSAEPVYAVAELTATEHIHTDESHENPTLNCGDRTTPISFALVTPECYNYYNKTYTQKFHLRFKTMDTEKDLPPIAYDTLSCTRGALTGRTGPGANPRVKLSWLWDNIDIDSCDASNPNGIYCDATQFSIALSKKMHALDAFLAANNYALECPPSIEEAINDQNFEHTVAADKIGLSRIDSAFATYANDVTLEVEIQNNTGTDQTVDVLIELYEYEEDSLLDSCDLQDIDVSQNGSAQASCKFESLEKGAYYAVAQMTSDTTTAIDDWEPMVPVSVIANPGTGNEDCWLLKSTEDLGGEPIINHFIRADDSVKWTPEISNINDLTNLVKFDALLIRDGYTLDFRQDFASYYAEQGFLSAPTYFSNAQGQEELKKYFLDADAMTFKRKYVDSSILPAPGRYKVKLIAVFGDDWRFFGNNDDPAAEVVIQFYHFKDPVRDSPFYRMPFDGLVGLEGASFDRQGYGSGFSNLAEEIQVNDPLVEEVAFTYESPSSNPVVSVETDLEQDFRKLNSLSSTRGNLLFIRSTAPTDMKMEFSPNYATPVIMKTTHNFDQEEFGSFYGITVDGSPIETGGVMTYWTGCGACLDYTGVPLIESFENRPDRAATANDRLPNWEYAYGVSWPYAVKDGDVYLRTEFYTPQNSEAIMRVLQPVDKVSLKTPDEGPQNNVGLSGISTMAYNNPGSTIDTLQEVFDLVAQQKVCVTNTGINARYWWDPAALHKQSGAANNLHVDCNVSISAEKGNCIGFGA